MNRAAHYWPAHTAAALCVASRWISAASLVMTILAFVAYAAALAPVIALGAAQIYLAVRIEFDRRIFELAAREPDGFAGFDDSGRSAQDRLAGLTRLVRWHGGLLAAQLVLTLAALTLAALALR
jgi:hypothetical protein